MKQYLFAALMILTANAHAFSVREWGEKSVIRFESSTDKIVAPELYQAVLSVIGDPLKETPNEITTEHFRIQFYELNLGDKFFTYSVESAIKAGPQHLRILQVGGNDHLRVFFEGEGASILIKGLTNRRGLNPKAYKVTQGKIPGDFTIETNGISCKYGHRLTEKYAECAIDTI